MVKVAGSNISHKLRLSSIKRSDEGTYECRVIDFSGSVAQHHRVRAYLQVEAERSLGHISADTLPQEPRHRGQGSQADLTKQRAGNWRGVRPMTAPRTALRAVCSRGYCVQMGRTGVHVPDYHKKDDCFNTHREAWTKTGLFLLNLYVHLWIDLFGLFVCLIFLYACLD